MATPGLDLREGIAGLVGYASRDLNAMWRQVSDAASAEAALRDILPSLIDTYGAAAATLAANWYDDLRVKHEVKGRFLATPAHIADSGAQELVGWAVSTATDLTALQALVLGGTQRRIANFSRRTVMDSSIRDPKATGWQRVGVGECKTGFCDMLIGRGAVYTEATADFAAHDHCQCGAIPSFGGQPRPVKPFTPSTRNISDADRARVREWIAAH